MRNILARCPKISSGDISAVLGFFDGVGYITSYKPPEEHLEFLRKHCISVGVERLERKQGDRIYYVFLVKMAVPDAAACHYLDKKGFKPYYVEPALNLILKDDATAWRYQAMFNVLFLQPWYGKRETGDYNGETFYSAARTSRFRRLAARYKGAFCKITGEIDYAHIELQFQGAEACKSIGIYKFSDLLSFDHKAFWRKHLNLYWPDLELRGRMQANWLRGERRRQALLTDCWCYSNMDLATGQTMYYSLGYHDRGGGHSLQAFVKHDRTGPTRATRRRSYLSKLNVSPILECIERLHYTSPYAQTCTKWEETPIPSIQPRRLKPESIHIAA
jgi:hypothetical protein